MPHLKAKCTKFDFGWGSVPDPAGELTALRQTPSWTWWSYFGIGREGREGKGKGRKGKGGPYSRTPATFLSD